MFPYLSGFDTTIEIGNLSATYQTIFYQAQTGEEIVEPDVRRQCFKENNNPSPVRTLRSNNKSESLHGCSGGKCWHHRQKQVNHFGASRY